LNGIMFIVENQHATAISRMKAGGYPGHEIGTAASGRRLRGSVCTL